MKNELHIVLGGSGAIGEAVIKALGAKNKKILAVERNKNVRGVKTIFADLLDNTQSLNAIKGATHVYVCVGLPYYSSIWQKNWPILIESVIEACSANGAKLIFFDNVYMYGPPPLRMHFDENEKQQPSTKKGIARKKVADMILDAHKSGKIKAVIGRSADFYGPNAINSALYIRFIENIIKGKNPQVLSKPTVKHTYAYSLDNGKALVELALDESTYGQVWHLPVGGPITYDEVVRIINRLAGSEYKISYLQRPFLGLLSLFVPILKETKEMLYQFDNPYVMSYKKFSDKFPDFKITKYEEGFKSMLESFKK